MYKWLERQPLRIAIQKSGRLYQQSIDYLNEKLDIQPFSDNGKLDYYDANKDIRVFFCREKDIPQLVENKTVDLGILGKNTFYESGYESDMTIDLDFSTCRLALAVPEDQDFKDLRDLNGKVIATSYPNILSDFLAENGIMAGIRELSGSVEIAPRMGIADAICDLVETGSTLKQNNLKEVATVFKSQAIALFRPNFRIYPYFESTEYPDMVLQKEKRDSRYYGSLCRDYS
jgi:ATP phosphoribosyltransferase